MVVFVTGGAGFIGSHFIKWALQQSHIETVYNLDALTYSGNLKSLEEELELPQHHFLKGTLQNPESYRKELAEADLIFNFAAESHVDRSIDSPEPFINTNILGTFQILETFRKYGKNGARFVQISTDEVYGSLGKTGFFTEDTALAPNSPYSSSKASADLLVRSYFHTYNLPLITTRCSNNYGPYQFPEKLIPLMIQRALQSEPLPVYGDGSNVRDWIYVEDHARGVWLAGINGVPGEVYNFGSHQEKTNLEVVTEILRYLKKPESLIRFVKDRPGHDLRYAIDPAKAQRELKWEPRVKFEAGLAKTIDWYLQNQEWVKSVASGEHLKFNENWYQSRL